MDRKLKRKTIEHVLNTLESIRLPQKNMASVKINDCIELLNDYYEIEFMEDVIEEISNGELMPIDEIDTKDRD